MKKYRKLTRIISLVFALCMLMSVTGLAAEVDEVAVIMERQSPAVNAYQSIWKSFGTDASGNTIWPDEFAGEYIDPSRGYKLIIKLTDTSEEMQKKYMRLSGNADCLIFEKAKYSLKYLESLRPYVDELNGAGYTVYEYVASHGSNTFKITIDKSKYDRLKKSELFVRMTELPIEIEAGDRAFYCATQMTGGSAIYNTTTATGCTVGIGGTYTYNGTTLTNCIVTCGHGNPANSTIRWGSSSGTACAVVKRQVLGSTAATATNGDFSIAQAGSGFTATNKVKGASGTYSITGTYMTCPLNTTILKYGKNSGYNAWTLTETHVSLNPDTENSQYPNYVHNLMKGTWTRPDGDESTPVVPGDSGGPVYVRRQTGEYWLLGLVTAGHKAPWMENTFYMYFTPILYAERAGFTVLTS